MKRRTRLVVIGGLLAVVVLAAWLVWDRASRRPPAGPSEFYRPDPAAPPAADDLKGAWTGEVVSPAGDARRVQTLRFVDGTHLVWEVTQFGRDGSEAASRMALRGRYEIANGELRFTVEERAAGDRALPPPADGDRVRVYELTRSAGELRVRPKGAEPGFNWSDVTFRRTGD